MDSDHSHSRNDSPPISSATEHPVPLQSSTESAHKARQRKVPPSTGAAHNAPSPQSSVPDDPQAAPKDLDPGTTHSPTPEAEGTHREAGASQQRSPSQPRIVPKVHPSLSDPFPASASTPASVPASLGPAPMRLQTLVVDLTNGRKRSCVPDSERFGALLGVVVTSVVLVTRGRCPSGFETLGAHSL